MVPYESTPANKNMFKVNGKKNKNKKHTGAISVNVVRVSLWLAWNIFFKSVTENVFSKASGLSYKQHIQQVYKQQV